jgi:hypothetical protein
MTCAPGPRVPRTEGTQVLVGDTGIEPVTSSVSTRSGSPADMRCWLYMLLRLLVSGGLWCCWQALFARSSPRFLPKRGCRLAESGIPSRRLRPAGPRLGGEGGAPHRTNDLHHPGAVWSPPVCDGSRSQVAIPERSGSRGGSPGRRRPDPCRRAGGPTHRRRICGGAARPASPGRLSEWELDIALGTGRPPYA